MKTTLGTLLLALILSCTIASAQDTLYIYRSGIVVTKHAVADIDSISFQSNAPKTETVTDIDGNVYHSVTIGKQTWMTENLKTTKYRNGDLIGTTSYLYMDLTYSTNPEYQWAYNGTESYVPIYGRLYTWYAATDSRNIAPVGWHVATNAEWTLLMNYLIENGYNYDKTTKDNKIAKALSSNSLWNSTTITGAPGNDPTSNNSSGLTMVPNGYRGFDGMFYNMGIGSNTWTATEYSSTLAYSPGCGYTTAALGVNNQNKNYGFSVRCVKDIPVPILSTNTPTLVTDTTAVIGGNITSDGGGGAVTARGVCWSTSANPTTSNSHTTDSLGIGSFTSKIKGLLGSTTYYLRAYATNATGTGYGNQVTITTYQKGSQVIVDIDGNTYHSVIIGKQTWMVENLKVSKYRNGDVIPFITDNTAWTTQTAGACTNYNNSDVLASKYGKLYNWYAVADTRNIAPVGWHIAGNGEWDTLLAYLGGGVTAAKKLKESGTVNWQSPNTSTNESGFTALPAGQRGSINGTSVYAGICTYWWISNRDNSNITYLRSLGGENASVDSYNNGGKSGGISVRCLKDTVPSLATSSITLITDTTATSGGNISDDGGVAISAKGVCWSTSPNPTTNDFKTTEVTGSFVSSLKGLIPSTTYYVRAYATNSVGTAYGNQISFTTLKKILPTVTDVDGNVYHTTMIGNQVWMVENLKTTKYRNGDLIGTTTSTTQDISTEISPKYQWAYNGVESNVSAFGRLYTWYAATDSRSIAPTGWHVATDAEWTTLENYLISTGHNYDGLTVGNKISKSLCSSTVWGTSTTIGSVGNDLSKNNSSGFNALPGGYRNINYFAYNKDSLWGGSAIWWSSSDDSLTNNGWLRMIDYSSTSLNRNGLTKACGMSIRCIKD